MSYIQYLAPVATDSNFDAKRQILVGVMQIKGLEVRFPFEVRSERTVSAILDDMRGAVTIIADLSLERPSVYFELGLAASTNRPLVLIAVAGTPIHQIPHPQIIHRYTSLASYKTLLENITRANVSPNLKAVKFQLSTL